MSFVAGADDHLVGLAENRVELGKPLHAAGLKLALGDVPEQHGQVVRTRIAKHLDCALGDHRRRVDTDRGTTFHGPAQLGLEHAADERGEEFEERAPQHLFARLVEVTQGRVVHVGHAPLPIEGIETVGNALDNRRQPRLGVVQRLFGLLALADVVARLENPLDSILVAHELHADGNRERPALLGATDQLPFPLANPGQNRVHLGRGGRSDSL